MGLSQVQPGTPVLTADLVLELQETQLPALALCVPGCSAARSWALCRNSRFKPCGIERPVPPTLGCEHSNPH